MGEKKRKYLLLNTKKKKKNKAYSWEGEKRLHFRRIFKKRKI